MLMYLVRNAHGLLFVAMFTSLLSGFSNASLGSGKTTLAKVLVGLYPLIWPTESLNSTLERLPRIEISELFFTIRL
ncbi:hypothetical protein [Rouxiella badensis]|uniref:hypothetical protein n=1 Tax=Rouxiella badensis TaxID=1646377 RepID=UPI0022AA7034|nr:hypothetical protein [Rouxiella badensis]WAT03960.1 hypothetical protein O1V64_16945 [Rouxiella badensis]WAT10475.1 hypothetical protein O1V65_07925 [Rouxiella badensis]